MLKRPTPDLVRFRAQATGIGSTRSASEWTGRSRSQRVIDAAPAAQRALAVGYPAPTPDEFSMTVPVSPMRRGPLRR